ncbi:MAG: hypothetical protein UW95_C0024G0009 [Parcubacteria group bacterium GW2011_GWC1_45_14]|nr:MAG: hypothetical protein UW95_C0024G0009 [Parcubacteria group bacterium GW2011_GWC1_45_14]
MPTPLYSYLPGYQQSFLTINSLLEILVTLINIFHPYNNHNDI